MLIEVYFQEITDLISSFPSINFFDITQEKRGVYEGFIRAKIIFTNKSYLHIREFIDVEFIVDKKMYSYQYMTADNDLIFRYDNAEHHRKLNLPNFPHHKHDRSENNVINSDAPFLKDVLREVTQLINSQNN